jgi:hypothetical protein
VDVGSPCLLRYSFIMLYICNPSSTGPNKLCHAVHRPPPAPACPRWSSLHALAHFARLAQHQCLHFAYIRDESIYRDITKMTAMCWTRCNYLNPTLADQTWKYWRCNLQDEILQRNTTDTIPKGWKKNPMICNNIIRACPFCDQYPWISKKVGTLEHLHIYYLSNILQGV